MLSERTPSSVLIVSGSDKISLYMSELLPATLFSPVNTVSSCGEAKRALISSEYDIVIINSPLPDELGTEFALDLVQNSGAGVMLLVNSELYNEISFKVEAYGVMTVSKPTSKAILYSAVKLAVATSSRLKTIQKKNRSLTSKMSEIRTVNRAKWVLIKHLNMDECEAHKYIEKQAMDLRLTKGEISENIIRTYEN